MGPSAGVSFSNHLCGCRPYYCPAYSTAKDYEQEPVKTVPVEVGQVTLNINGQRHTLQAIRISADNCVANQQSFGAAAKSALSQAEAHKDDGFKIELAKRMLVKALTTVGGMA